MILVHVVLAVLLHRVTLFTACPFCILFCLPRTRESRNTSELSLLHFDSPPLFRPSPFPLCLLFARRCGLCVSSSTWGFTGAVSAPKTPDNLPSLLTTTCFHFSSRPLPLTLRPSLRQAISHRQHALWSENTVKIAPIGTYQRSILTLEGSRTRLYWLRCASFTADSLLMRKIMASHDHNQHCKTVPSSQKEAHCSTSYSCTISIVEA